jgi:hypothetical protein
MDSKLPPLSSVEEAQLSRFKSFYTRLPNRENLFYMFFTSGLLHWALRTSRLASRAGQVVLIGAGLSQSEITWLRNHSALPFHHILGPADDKTVWELLFRTNEHNFGWIDVDCFVLSPDLLVEMTRLEPGALASCVWSTPYNGFHILTTYALFLSAEVLRDVTAHVAVTPSTYSYEVTGNSRTIKGTTRPLTAELIERLTQVLPAEPGGRPPRYPFGDNFFDTLQLYQFVAQTMGYHLQRIRPLFYENTEEIVHVGKVSYYTDGWSTRDLPENRQRYTLLLQAELLMLKDLRGSLPTSYELRWRKLTGELERLGIDPDPEVIEHTMRGVLAGSGITLETFSRMLKS